MRLLELGIDPRAERERRRREERAKRDNRFGIMMEDYIRRHVTGKRKATDVEREIRSNLLPAWRPAPQRMPPCNVGVRSIVTLFSKYTQRW